jgi:hypothetical protein
MKRLFFTLALLLAVGSSSAQVQKRISDLDGIAYTSIVGSMEIELADPGVKSYGAKLDSVFQALAGTIAAIEARTGVDILIASEAITLTEDLTIYDASTGTGDRSKITYSAQDNATNQTIYGTQTIYVNNATDGTEDAQMHFNLMHEGTLSPVIEPQFTFRQGNTNERPQFVLKNGYSIYPGSIWFQAEDLVNAIASYAVVQGEVVDATSGIHEGAVSIHTAETGTLAERFRFLSTALSPVDDGTRDIGTTGLRFRNGYFDDLYITNGIPVADLNNVNAGTSLTADLEEETHATEHSDGAADEIVVTNLASACTDAQVLGGDGAGGVECQADDDVPEAGDFANAADLDLNGNVTSIGDATEVADKEALGTQLGENLVAKGATWVSGHAVIASNADSVITAGAAPFLTTGGTVTGNLVVSGAQSYGTPQASYTDTDLILLQPTNIKVGATYTWIFTQNGDATPRTVARGIAATAFPDSIVVDPNTNASTFVSCYASSTSAFSRCWNDSYYVDTKQWHAGALSTDGTEATGCSTPREVTINSGPKRFIVNCEDNATSTMYFDIVMPDGWDTRGITLELAAMDTTTATTVLDIDFSAQCRGDGDVVNNTWGTAQNASITFGGTAYTLEHATTAAITPNGTCAAGDHVFIKGDVDDAGGNTNGTNWILALKAEFGLISGG